MVRVAFLSSNLRVRFYSLMTLRVYFYLSSLKSYTKHDRPHLTCSCTYIHECHMNLSRSFATALSFPLSLQCAWQLTCCVAFPHGRVLQPSCRLKLLVLIDEMCVNTQLLRYKYTILNWHIIQQLKTQSNFIVNLQALAAGGTSAFGSVGCPDPGVAAVPTFGAVPCCAFCVSAIRLASSWMSTICFCVFV